MAQRSTRSTWRDHVSAWERSGLTGREYARRAGVSPGQLSWWKWKLGGSAARVRGPRHEQDGLTSRQCAQVAATPRAFLEARIVSPIPTESSVDAAGGSPVEIVASRPRVVRVRAGFDPLVLQQVLRVLEVG